MFSEAQPRGPNELDWPKAGLKTSSRICVPSMSFALRAGLMKGPCPPCPITHETATVGMIHPTLVGLLHSATE